MTTNNNADDLVTITIAAPEPRYEFIGCQVFPVKQASRGERLLGFDAAGNPITEEI